MSEQLERTADEPTERRETLLEIDEVSVAAAQQEAVALRRKRGLKTRRLEDGMPEWRLAGLPVAR